MPRWVQVARRRSVVLRVLYRFGACCAAAALGVLGAALLIAGAQSAWAAPAAQIRQYPGDAPCNSTLQACIDGVNEGDTILIQPNTYVTSLTLSKAVSLTGVASNTVILQALPDQRVLTVTGAAVNSSVVISGLTFTGGSVMGIFGAGGGILLTNGAQPRLDSIRVISNQVAFNGGGIYGLSVTLRNSVVQSNTALLAGGGVGAFDSATIIGSRIEANTCTSDWCLGGGLYVGAATLTGTSFVANSARYQGGGLLATGAVTLSGGLFQQNTCTQTGCVGGGLHTSATLRLNGTSFFSNSATLAGGGAYVVSATLATGGLFRGNACTAAGCAGGALSTGAASVLSGTQAVSNSSAGYAGGVAGVIALAVTNSSIYSNTAASYGGGLYMLGPDPILDVINSQFVGNRSHAGSGGAGGADRAYVTGSLFQNNACLDGGCDGGGLNAFVLYITNTVFISNTAGNAGGGSLAYSTQVMGSSYQRNACTDPACRGGGLYSNLSLVLDGTTFLSNTAQGRGGGAFGEGSVYLTGGLFQANRALEQHGGGVWSYHLHMADTLFTSNTAALGGGAIHAVSSASLSGGRLQGNGCLQAGCLGGGLLAAAAHVSGTQLYQNSAQGNGGAAAVTGTAEFVGGALSGNTCTLAGCQGGGLQAASRLVITGTQFLGNRAAGMGGGVAHLAGAGSVVNALFARNSAGTFGAALYLASGGAVNVYHTTMASPTLAVGAAVDVVSGTVQILDTLFANYSAGIRHLSAGDVFEDYNLFYAVTAPTVGALVGGSGAHDVVGNPQFANPAGDNYHLTAGSAAMEVGADVGVSIDFDGDPRPYGDGFDIGYDEYTPSRLFLPLVER